MPTVISELLSHRLVQVALALVGLILVGSLTYYLLEVSPPTLAYTPAATGSITQDITGSGSVSPVENPDLSFAASGRVMQVNAVVGRRVSAGSVLATLDTGVLAANLAAAQAKLDELIAGPRAVDLAGAQTSLQGAQTTLPDTLRTAESQAETAVANTDPFFTDAQTNPQLGGVLVNDYDLDQKINQERRALNIEIASWRTAAAAGSATSDETLAHLRSVAAYLNDLSTILSTAKAANDAQTATLASDAAIVSAARTTVSGQMGVVNQAALAVTSAQNTLNLTQAGARTEDIDAQRAQVESIAAQLRQEEIIAPFAGTIGSVSVKSGDVVTANSTAISLIPDGKFEVPIYVSEIEMSKLAVGDAADITLDAYGASRVFPGTVSVIDRAPSTPAGGGTPGYKITLVFSQADPAITVGMHANVTIHGGQKASALLVPRSSLIEDGAQTYVLKKTAAGPVKTLVSIGLVNATSAEIVSGLSVGDQVARAGTH